MKKKKSRWLESIYLGTSTSDIIRTQTSGNYVPRFMDDNELKKYTEVARKKVSKKRKAK